MTEYPPGPPPGNYPPPPPGGYPPPPPPGGGYSGYPGGYPAPPAAGTNGMAIASLVCSLVGWLCGLGPILGVVFGVIALNQIKQSGQEGRGLALAGVIIGTATIVIGVIAFIVAMVVGANQPST
jgi:Domain of unknown function (DUF4190)